MQWHFPKKVLFFEKVTLLVITHNWWHFLKKKYVIVLPKQQVWPPKTMVQCNVLVFIGCGRGLICKNIHCWKNYALCIFSKVIKKLEVKTKMKTSDWAFLKNARLDVFGFFITHHFFITFEKIHKAYFFQHSRFLAHSTLTQFSVKCFIIFFQHSWKMLFQPFADFFTKIHTCLQIVYLADLGEAKGWFTNTFVIH